MLRWEDSIPIPLPAFQALLTAATNSSTQLEHLIIERVPFSDDTYDQALKLAIPSLKIKEFTLLDWGSSTEEQTANLLEALNKNYVLQKVQGLGLETQLELFLSRNRKLAEWTDNPMLVPRELWSFALSLALEAGVNSLYQNLLAFSGEGVGLQPEGVRKRKRPQ